MDVFIPPPGCLAVIFVSQRTAGEAGYVAMAERMAELAAQQPGFLGVRSARDADGLGLTVSYWASEADIAAWRAVLAHQAARDQGRSRWYEAYELVVARVERGYGWCRADGTQDPLAGTA
jgi:heme-degrading monooxygenase HmoA